VDSNRKLPKTVMAPPLVKVSGTVTVQSNASVSLAYTQYDPTMALVTLNLTVSWPAAKVQTAQIPLHTYTTSGSAWT
jgi:hypothetical protein